MVSNNERQGEYVTEETGEKEKQKPKKIIMAFIIIILVAILEGFHDYHVIQSINSKAIFNNKRWHQIGAVMITLLYSAIAHGMHGFTYCAFAALLVFLSIRFLVFDSVLNVLRKKWPTYVGEVAFMDRMQRLIAKKIGVNPTLVSLVLKVAALFISMKFYLG